LNKIRKNITHHIFGKIILPQTSCERLYDFFKAFFTQTKKEIVVHIDKKQNEISFDFSSLLKKQFDINKMAIHFQRESS
jgi:hypothetical protein